jgi:hypothetical protein
VDAETRETAAAVALSQNFTTIGKRFACPPEHFWFMVTWSWWCITGTNTSSILDRTQCRWISFKTSMANPSIDGGRNELNAAYAADGDTRIHHSQAGRASTTAAGPTL